MSGEISKIVFEAQSHSGSFCVIFGQFGKEKSFSKPLEPFRGHLKSISFLKLGL